MAKKRTVLSPQAPSPIGPYSQAIRSGKHLFLSGQIPIDPQTGQLVEGGIQAETRQVLENLRAVLEAGGSGLKQVVKTTVYLLDLAEFATFNEVYQSYFHTSPPARSTVQVAALPRGARVEIEAVARVQ